MSYLVNLLKELIAGTVPSPHRLSGGTRLDVFKDDNGKINAISATRDTLSGLQDGEASIFRACIKQAGYYVIGAEPIELPNSGSLNTWLGVKWQITKNAPPAPPVDESAQLPLLI